MNSAHSHSAPTASWSTLEPYAQLLRSLLPRTEDIWIFDAASQLRWTTESMTGPDLPMLVEAAQQRARDDLALPGEAFASDRDATPVYLWWLRTDAGEVLATVAVSMRRSGDTEPSPFSRVNALVRPAIECLRRELVSQTSLVDLAERLAARDKDMELLLSVSDGENTEPAAPADELKAMLQRAADHMGCVLTALIVPEKSIALMRAASGRQPDGSLLARTHRQLLNLMQTRREAVIINRVTSGSGHESQPYRILCCPLRHPNGRTTGALALFREASAAEFEPRDARLIELLARKASASIEASYDSVTGLLTRPALEQRVIAMASDASVPRLLSALYIDVDQMHAINENFGMHEGDGVLGQIGELLRRRLPAGGLAARISGDRFALLLPLARDQATEFAEALREAAAQLGSTHASTRLHVSISIGVASLERSHEGLAHALAAAETACKAAKDRGRNRVDVHEEADLSIIRRFTDITTAGELREAIASNRFRLDAQLIQPLGDSGGISHPPHFELLLRMIGTNGETVGPDRFLSAARRYQLMPAIDRWVVSQAIEMLKPHAAQLAHRPVVFSINFSGQSLGDDEFADFLFQRIEGSGIAPGVLCFELTESDAVQNIARAEMLMRGLRRLGCGVALDDFGTGLSSLAYLRSLPATILKIDGSFVRDILRDPRSESMVQAIAQLARNIGIATVAEYAETPELVTRLTALGVDFGQGFAIGRPVPLVEVLDELPLYAALTPLVSASIEASGPHAIAVNQ